SFDLNYSGVLMPAELTLKNKVKSSSTGYGHHRLYGMDFDFDGTLESECEIVGIETVKANDVSYEAFKIEWSFGIKGDGVLDLTAYGEKAYNFTHTLHQDITYWAVPGIGVVKSSTKINVKLKANGMGSEIWTSSYVKELIP
ncbi:MAG: hypothetical protein K9M57_07255, partial [Phycisphaerae bacterium]|nr:hypothetical protein [Phycisphaerae bacterium]